MNQLVKGAVGFNGDRGDVVTVVATKFEPQIDPNAVPWYRDENYQTIVNAGVIGGIFLVVFFAVVRPMVRRLLAPEIDPKALADAAAQAASLQAQMAIDVATAESVAAKNAAESARQAHEGEMVRISEEAMRAAQESARLAEEARLAAEAKAAADAKAAAVIKARIDRLGCGGGDGGAAADLLGAGHQRRRVAGAVWPCLGANRRSASLGRGHHHRAFARYPQLRRASATTVGRRTCAASGQHTGRSDQD